MEIGVIKTGGKQYKVSKGQVLLIERLKNRKQGEEISFENLLSGKKVIGRILGEEKGKKVTIFKYKPRKRSRRKKGHRQAYTKIEIKKIE